jgi:hypothetical protein
MHGYSAIPDWCNEALHWCNKTLHRCKKAL